MIARIIAIALLTVSFSMMAGAIITNQIHPTYGTAFGVPLANMAGLVVALLAVVASFAGEKSSRDSKLARRTMVLAIAWAVALAVLFPFTDLGHLSKFS